MKIGDIEKKYPIPSRTTGKYNLVRKQIKRMQVGDSFLIRLEENDKVKAAHLQTLLNKGRKAESPRYMARNAGQGGDLIRLWRVE